MATTSNETTKTGVIFRVLAAIAPVTWNRISFWTSAADVHFENSESTEDRVLNLEDRMGNQEGITSDISSSSEKIAASTELVHGLNNPLPITIAVNQWNGATIQENGGTYYTYTYQATKVWTAYPIAILAPLTDAFRIPSPDEQKQYNNIEYVSANTSDNTITFFARKIPNIALKIVVKGAE